MWSWLHGHVAWKRSPKFDCGFESSYVRRKRGYACYGAQNMARLNECWYWKTNLNRIPLVACNKVRSGKPCQIVFLQLELWYSNVYCCTSVEILYPFYLKLVAGLLISGNLSVYLEDTQHLWESTTTNTHGNLGTNLIITLIVFYCVALSIHKWSL
jgi:hypothetical protein